MGVVLSISLTGQLVQMPAAGRSLPRTSELILHGLLLYELGRSRPLWVSLQIQRHFVNRGIIAAFLSVHRWPYQLTCGTYPIDLQNTSLTTTSNDELGQEEGKIAPGIGEKQHGRAHFLDFFVPERAPLLMGCLPHIRDTVLVL
jgi:hypothetical protein